MSWDSDFVASLSDDERAFLAEAQQIAEDARVKIPQ